MFPIGGDDEDVFAGRRFDHEQTPSGVMGKGNEILQLLAFGLADRNGIVGIEQVRHVVL